MGIRTYTLAIDVRESALIAEVKKIISSAGVDEAQQSLNEQQLQQCSGTNTSRRSVIGVERTKNYEILVVVEQLPLGDVILGTPEASPAVIIERKTISDLIMSHSDGRYEEQTFRLNGQSTPNHNICYLIEGNPYTSAAPKGKGKRPYITYPNAANACGDGAKYAKYKYGRGCNTQPTHTAPGKCLITIKSAPHTPNHEPIVHSAPPQVLLPRPINVSAISSMFSLQYYKGFTVTRTNDVVESAWYICTAIRKLAAHPERIAYTQLNAAGNTADVIDTHANEKARIIDIDGDADTAQNNADHKPSYNQMHANGLASNFTGVVSKIKSANITRENIAEIMLSQIPKISTATAAALINKFSTLDTLIRMLGSDAKCLEDIRVGESKRRLQKHVRGTLIEYLHI